ncbi:unnamed protein product [Arctogadus glacialis]
MASLDVQPRLTEARPDPDTPAQMRAAVARYLAANALKDKALSTQQQKNWAAREEKYRKEWEQIGVWAVGVKVTTGLTTAAWEHTLRESEWAATRRANTKKVRDTDSVDYRKKREKYTYALLNAYNAAINMETRKREGRLTDLSRQEKTVLKGLPAPPHVEERAAPLTLDGADVEGKGMPCGEDNTSLRNNTYPSLEENPPLPNKTRAPPPYGCYDHPAPRDSKGPALQFPILHIEKGPVEVSYNDQPPPSFAGGSQDYRSVEYDSTKGPRDGTDRASPSPIQPNNNNKSSPSPTRPSCNPTPNPIQPNNNKSSPSPTQPNSSSYNPTPNSTQPSNINISSYNPTTNPTQPSTSNISSYNPTPSNISSYNPTPSNINISSSSYNPTTNPTQPSTSNISSYNPTPSNINISSSSYNPTPNPTGPSSYSYNPTRSSSYNPAPNSSSYSYNPARSSYSYNPAPNSSSYSYNPARSSYSYNPAPNSSSYSYNPAPSSYSYNPAPSSSSYNPAPSISSYNATPYPTQPYSTHPNSNYNTIHNYHNTRKFYNPSSIYKETKAVPPKDSTDKDTWGARTP